VFQVGKDYKPSKTIEKHFPTIEWNKEKMPEIRMNTGFPAFWFLSCMLAANRTFGR
jgi:hypothetical protein